MLKSVAKISIVFITIAIISGSILGIAYYFTKTDESSAFLDAVSENFGSLNNIEVVNTENINYNNDFSFVKNVVKSDDNTYIFESVGKGGYGGNVVLLIAIKDNEIVEIIVYSASETPGLGTKVLNEDYLAQYKNVSLVTLENNFNLGKKTTSEVSKYFSPPSSNNAGEKALDGGVSAVTGATRTSNAVLHSINCAVFYYKELNV